MFEENTDVLSTLTFEFPFPGEKSGSLGFLNKHLKAFVEEVSQKDL